MRDLKNFNLFNNILESIDKAIFISKQLTIFPVVYFWRLQYNKVIDSSINVKYAMCQFFMFVMHMVTSEKCSGLLFCRMKYSC